MASGKTSSESTDPLICHICMEVYKKPKFLPCFHTFCARCIQDWADQSRRRGVSTFPCPVCRESTSLPKGGVNKLQSNFYFCEKELEKVRTGKLCLVHRKKELELFCVPCREVICLKCKVVDHSSHATLDLAEALDQKKQELKEGRERITVAIKTLESLSKEKEAQQRNNQEQLSTAKTVARKVIASTANAVRRFTLNRLQSCYEYVDRDVAGDMNRLSTHQQEMKALDKELTEASSCEDMKKLFTVAEELSSGKGSKKSLDKMVKESNKSKNHPSLYRCMFVIVVFAAVIVFHLVASFTAPSSSSHEEMESLESFSIVPLVPFRMVKQFQCAKEKDTKVYALCVTNYFVVISYEQRGLREDVASESFTREGERYEVHKDAREKSVWCRIGQVCISVRDLSRLFSKSHPVFRLSSSCTDGQADILRVTQYLPALSDDIHMVFVFSIKVRRFRAFDANSKGNLFAVIEKGLTPNLQQTVKIFRKPELKPFATFVPYNSTFQPLDLCFYNLLEEEVLLIVDEWKHHIHVVGVKHEMVIPLGYLESGCPSGRNPRVITVDPDGDLWVACQGGSIVKTEHSLFLQMLVWVQQTFRNVTNRYTV